MKTKVLFIKEYMAKSPITNERAIAIKTVLNCDYVITVEVSVPLAGREYPFFEVTDLNS